MKYRSPLAQARGLGSAKSGTHHWWMQRVTAIALVPLIIWFLVSALGLLGADYDVVKAWVAQPLTSVLLVLFVSAFFYHMKLGLQVVIEDYVHGEGRKLALLLTVNFAAIALSVACIFSILKIAFGG
ncbi:MAG: succinate dehydrogenase, hydrophobic membrane anchor protein [Sphingomonadales bacterium]|jgi:succinate dehydrogenase / fumarate reductase membrane anchor subunit